MATVKIIKDEPERGCGFRHPGLYLISEGIGRTCGKLPLPLTVCPCCGAGIKHSLGWTWVDAKKLFEKQLCRYLSEPHADLCCTCPLDNPPEKVGLIWIGEQYYATPEEYLNEAGVQGISRRVAAVPRGFTVGKDWVLLAHKKAIANADGTYTPAIFYMFQPTRIEYVVKGTETEEELNELERRGLTLVKLERTDGKGWQLNPGWKRFHNVDGSVFYRLGDYIVISQKKGTQFVVRKNLIDADLWVTTTLKEAKRVVEGAASLDSK